MRIHNQQSMQPTPIMNTFLSVISILLLLLPSQAGAFSSITEWRRATHHPHRLQSDDTSEKPVFKFQNSVDIQNVYAAKEFEKQILGRLSAGGFNASQLTSYKLLKEDQIDLYNDELIPAQDQLTNIPTVLNWEKGLPRMKKVPESQKGTYSEFECDLYFKITEMEAGMTSSIDHIFKDVVEKKIGLNFDIEDSLEVEAGDWVWVEIAETPQSLKSKMMQLERAYRCYSNFDKYFGKKNEHEFSVDVPKYFIICLNGEPNLFDMAADHVRKLYEKKKLDKWSFLDSGIQCVLTYTPYRNVYGVLKTMNDEIATIKDEIATIKDDIATTKDEMANMNDKMATKDDMKNMDKKLDTLLKLLDS